MAPIETTSLGKSAAIQVAADLDRLHETRRRRFDRRSRVTAVKSGEYLAIFLIFQIQGGVYGLRLSPASPVEKIHKTDGV
jgi:hypothetical protein